MSDPTPYEKLAALRAELEAVHAEIQTCVIADVLDLQAVAETLERRIEFWEEKIADWSSDVDVYG